MCYTTVEEVRNSNNIFNTTNITDEEILSNIKIGFDYINSKLNKLFQTPLKPKEYKTGLISGVKDALVITGIDTLFLDDVSPSIFIKVMETLDVFKISNIASNTSLTVYNNITKTFVNSNFFIVPSELAQSNKFLAIDYLFFNKFPEKYNNENSAFGETSKKFGLEFLNQFLNNSYYNSDFIGQIETKTNARIVNYTSISNTNKVRVNEFISTVSRCDFE